MSGKHYSHLFGPVPSRRFGRSLGIDLVPFKTCSFDCIFCQLGRTTVKTIERREYVSIDGIFAELGSWFDSGGAAEYVTLAGSGEPTLNSGFGRVIEFAHRASDIPVALLTNGSLLTDPEVTEQAARADVVKVSLSAWDRASLEHINRPHADVVFEDLLAAQHRLRKQLRGELWLEVFLVWGSNTTAAEVGRVAALVASIRPDKVQLNTAVRPPCEEYAYAVPEERMAELAQLFDPPAEIIPEYRRDDSGRTKATEHDILEMLQRRPCTLEQICQVFGLHRNEVSKYLGRLTREGRVVQQRKSGSAYYLGVHEGHTEKAVAPGAP